MRTGERRMNIQIENLNWIIMEHNKRNYVLYANGSNGNSIEIKNISYKHLLKLKKDIETLIPNK